MTRLGIDGSNIRQGGGVTHLSSLLACVEPQRYGFESVVLWAGRDILELIPDAPWLEKSHQNDLDGGIRSRLSWQKFRLPALAEKSCDLVFAPGGLCGVRNVPFVTMCQNLLPFMWEELRRYKFSYVTLRLILLRYGQLSTFRRAAGLIYLSEDSRQRLENGLLGSEKPDSTVVYHGVDERFFGEPPPDMRWTGRDNNQPIRLLYVSIIDMYKHPWNVAEAVARLRKEGLPVELTLIGPAYAPALRKLRSTLARLDPAGDFLHYKGPVPYSDLPEIYRGADLFLFASTCETFGMILLEAMASGTPVLCSDRTAMPEILQDHGGYFDPEAVDGIVEALRSGIGNDERRNRLAAGAYRRAREFTWERCADQTFGFLAEMAKKAR